jgi:hypothetical protein
MRKCIVILGSGLRRTLLLILAVVTCLSVFGCGKNDRMIPVQVTDYRQISVSSSDYGRIDISMDDLEHGLTEILAQVAQRTGPVHAEPIVKDYAPVVQQALYNTGYCSIQRLNINDFTVDIDVYFSVKQSHPALMITAYINGEVAPAYSVVNQYYVSASN